MTFNGLITTGGPPQWREGAGPRQLPSQEIPLTSHKRTRAGSLLLRAGGGLGGPAGGAGTCRTATPGPGGNQAAPDRGKGTEQRGGTPGLQQRCLHRISLRWQGRGRPAAPGPGARSPPERWEQRACEERRGQRRGTRVVTHGPGKPWAPEGAILEPSCAASTPARPEDAEYRHPPPRARSPPRHGPRRGGHSPSPRSCSPRRRSCRQSPGQGAGAKGGR